MGLQTVANQFHRVFTYKPEEENHFGVVPPNQNQKQETFCIPGGNSVLTTQHKNTN